MVRPLSSDGEDTWQHGNSLLNYIKMVSIFHITPGSEGENTQLWWWGHLAQHGNWLLNYFKMVSTPLIPGSEGETT